MKRRTKNEMRNICARHGFKQPRFSGKRGIAFLPVNVSYRVEQHLIEMADRMRYKYFFCVV